MVNNNINNIERLSEDNLVSSTQNACQHINNKCDIPAHYDIINEKYCSTNEHVNCGTKKIIDNNLENRTAIENKRWNICPLAYTGCLESQDKSNFFEICSNNYEKCETHLKAILLYLEI